MDKAAVCRYTWPSDATHFTTEAAFCLPSPVFSPAHALGCTQARNPAQTFPLSFQCPFEGSHQCLDLFSLSGSLSKSFNSHPALFKQKPELTGLLPWGGIWLPPPPCLFTQRFLSSNSVLFLVKITPEPVYSEILSFLSSLCSYGMEEAVVDLGLTHSQKNGPHLTSEMLLTFQGLGLLSGL